MNHYVPIEVIVEFVSSVYKYVQKKIKETIIQLDFENKEITQYFDFLATGMIKATQ